MWATKKEQAPVLFHNVSIEDSHTINYHVIRLIMQLGKFYLSNYIKFLRMRTVEFR